MDLVTSSASNGWSLTDNTVDLEDDEWHIITVAHDGIERPWAWRDGIRLPINPSNSEWFHWIGDLYTVGNPVLMSVGGRVSTDGNTMTGSLVDTDMDFIAIGSTVPTDDQINAYHRYYLNLANA